MSLDFQKRKPEEESAWYQYIFGPVGATAMPDAITDFASDMAAIAFTPAWSVVRRMAGQEPYQRPEATPPPVGGIVNSPPVVVQNTDAEMPRRKSRTGKSMTKKRRAPTRGRRKTQSRSVKKPQRPSTHKGGRQQEKWTKVRTSVQEMPVASTALIESGTRARFTQPVSANNLRLQIKVFYDSVASWYESQDSKVVASAVSLWDSEHKIPPYSEVVIHPVWDYYMPSNVHDITKLFQYYRVNSWSFAYEPRSTTNTDLYITCGSVPDVQYPESHNLIGLDGKVLFTVPHRTLASIPNAQTLNVYRPATHQVKCDRAKKYTTINWDPFNGIDYDESGATAAELRAACSGIFLINGAYSHTGAVSTTNGYHLDRTLGDLYMIIDIDLYEFSTANVTTTNALTAKQRRLRTLQEDLKALSRPAPSGPSAPFSHNLQEPREFSIVSRGVSPDSRLTNRGSGSTS